MQKRMISVILCLTLLIGMLPAAVAVVPGMKGGTSTNVGNSEGLQDLTIEDGIAAVRFAVSEDAELVVAVYEEESGRQIASAKTTVRPSDSTAILPLDTALPQNFHAEAFLLSPNDYTPLCESLRVEVNEPTLPTEPSEPTETTAPTEPSEPTETTAPTEPSEPTETAAPTEPSEPTETAAPTEPSEPTETAAPTEPSEPTETAAPTEPSEPTETAAPTEPSEPTETAAPTEPTEPTEPPESNSGTCGENLTWTLDENGVLTISGTGDMYNYNSNNKAPWFGRTINAAVIEDGVTSIGSEAFNSCSHMTNVTIASSVTRIGTSAFTLCSGLTDVVVPFGVTNLEGGVFGQCGNLRSVTLPEGITSIGYATFFDCNKLASIVIPSSVTSIGGVAFFNCNKMTSISLPDGITEIGKEAFWNCCKLESVKIPSSLTKINEKAFYGCSSLTDITIPEGVTSIEASAFAYCSKAESITIPSSVTRIGAAAFKECSKVTSVTIPSSVTDLEGGVFSGCKLLANVTLPEGMDKIPGSMFYNCSELRSFTIPASVTSIGDYAFSRCFGLRTISIPAGVTSIGKNAFDQCEILNHITIPSSVKTIGMEAFRWCFGLSDITIESGVSSIGYGAFDRCRSLSSITLPASVTELGEKIFSNCFSLTAIWVDEGNETYASDESGVLLNKDKTELICYPVGRTGAYEIPAGVTTIKSKAFDGCTELTSLMFPSSITNIEEYAFSYSSKLTSLYFFGDGPDINWAAFDNVDVTAYYPAENSTWEKTIGTIYSFGKVKWVPWTPEKDAQAAPVVRGLHTGKADGSTVSFSGLTSGEQYVLIMAKDKNGDLLAPENLLYIAQGAADADGALTFATAPRESAENAFVALYGPGESVQPGYQPCDGSNCPGRVFSDMPVRGNWAHDPIDWAIGGGVTNGTSATTFSPEEGCARAQVVTFLWRAAGQPEPTSSANPFADVKAGQYYYKAVLWAVEHGITNGMSATEFGPDNTCTRAQIVTFLWRYEGKPAPSSTRNPFADVSTGSYYGSAVLWAVEHGITNGMSATEFCPENTCTRAQVVTFLYRDVVNQ